MYPELDYGLVIDVAECRRWPYQTGKTLKVQNNTYNEVMCLLWFRTHRLRPDWIKYSLLGALVHTPHAYVRVCICDWEELHLCCCCYCFSSHNDRNCCFCFGFYSYNDVLQLAPWNEVITLCVYSNSRNDISRVARRYGTIAHTPGAVRPSPRNYIILSS